MSSQINRRVFDTVVELWGTRVPLMNMRDRLKRYTYGDQWGDIVYDDNGVRIIESELLKRSGRRPVSNNLIRRLVKAVIGRYREMAVSNSWYDTPGTTSDIVADLDELDCRLLEEFLISGMAIQRVADDDPLAGHIPCVRNVSPDKFFCNAFRDPAGADIDMVGMLHDMSPAEVFMRFAGKRGMNSQKLGHVFEASRNRINTLPSAPADLFIAEPGRLRVIEVWSREFDNARNLLWRVRWFAPDGTLLDSYTSPWAHGTHPFVVKFYPLTDGEIHSFVEDVVEQQRYINRIIVLIDRIMSTSAKGVLLFPTSQKENKMSWEEICKRWAAPDGVIPITGNGPHIPTQVSGTNGDLSAYRLLEMELKLFDRTAGVGAALLGEADGESATQGIEKLRAKVENATIALADIFYTFRAHIRRRDTKLNAICSPRQK